MANTLVIGLGGSGLNIVSKVAERVEDEARRELRDDLENIEFVVMDTDVNALRVMAREHPRVRRIQTSPRGTVGAALDKNKYASEEWFPLNESIMGKPFSEGAGQVRAISRLALDHTIQQGLMRPLEEAIENLRGLSGETLHQEMRVMICGSLAGGTGSGILLPVAMYVRKYLQTRYQDYAAIIRGLFLEPDTFFDVIQTESERNSLRCNAYAAIRELDAFFRKYHNGDMGEFEGVHYYAPLPGSGERAPYPSLLPYNFVFLLDAINEEGEHLPTKAAYEQHAADILYAQALSPASSLSNSAEDNVIKQQEGTGGRSRYSGAGASFMVYPVKMIRRYVALRWASQSISSKWTYLDRAYQRAAIRGDGRTAAEFYRQTFEASRDEGDNDFIGMAGEGTVLTASTTEDHTVVTKEYSKSDAFVEDVLEHAEDWNEHELAKVNVDIERYSSKDALERLPSKPETIGTDHTTKGGSDGIRKLYKNRFGSCLERLRSYWSVVRSGVEGNARAAFRQTYQTMGDENPFMVHNQKWHFESLISEDEGATALHPAGIRYLLYACIQSLDTQIDELQSSLEGLKPQIDGIIGSKAAYGPFKSKTINEAVDSILGMGADASPKISLPMRKDSISEDSVQEFIRMTKRLSEAWELVDSSCLYTVQIEAMRACKRYLEGLAKAYEAFFNSLEERIESIAAEIRGIEEDPRYNTRRGRTRRYVCASKAAIRRMYEECTMASNAGELPGESCALLHRSLAGIAIVNDGNSLSDKQRSLQRRRCQSIFEKTIMRYWESCVEDPSNRNARILDKTVTQALVDEARFANEGRMLDDEQMKEAIAVYVENAFAEMEHLATPFVERPLSTTLQEISVCTYSPEVLQGVDAYRDLIASLLARGRASDSCEKTSILFYRSVYGFRADQLPKYAPAHSGHEHRAAGEYHRVYWSTVNKLSPVLAANKAVTPHIDRNWHLITHLPDLSEEYERQLVANTFKAFLYGLISGQFSADHTGDGDIFKLSATEARDGYRRSYMELLVSNHTVCDRFYEVYDALTFNPRIVSELLERYDTSLKDELNQIGAPSVEKSLLMGPSGIQTRAYSRDPEALRERRQAVLDGIDAAKSMDPAERAHLHIEDHTVDFVTRLFSTTYDGDPHMHMSLFTVPLLYRLSLHYDKDKSSQISDMIHAIFAFVKDYVSNFCEVHDCDDLCDRLFCEQYLVFEENVAWLERYIEGANHNPTTNEIRESIRSHFQSSKYRDTVNSFMNEIDRRWK